MRAGGEARRAVVCFIYSANKARQRQAGSIQHSARVGFSLVRDYNFFSRLNLARPVSWELAAQPFAFLLTSTTIKVEIRACSVQKTAKGITHPPQLHTHTQRRRRLVCLCLTFMPQFNFYCAGKIARKLLKIKDGAQLILERHTKFASNKAPGSCSRPAEPSPFFFLSLCALIF